MEKEKREYYILAGGKGMKELLIEKGIDISPMHLLIISENSKIGRLIRKKSLEEFNKLKNKNL